MAKNTHTRTHENGLRLRSSTHSYMMWHTAIYTQAHTPTCQLTPTDTHMKFKLESDQVLKHGFVCRDFPVSFAVKDMNSIPNPGESFPAASVPLHGTYDSFLSQF
jgi:hypothetical protein